MKRHTTFALTSVTLLGLAIVCLPKVSSAQSALVGTWKLNVAKSTFSPGPGPRSQTATVEAEGQGLKFSLDTINAQGNPAKGGFIEYHDGKFHPVTGNPVFDAQSETDINDSTSVIIRTKAGKVVQALIAVVSPDRKTWTVTVAGNNANGQPLNNVMVRERQ
jgi:hypothetical protein